MFRAFWYQLLSAILSLPLLAGAFAMILFLTSREKPPGGPWFFAGALLATAVSAALLLWVRVARARWLLDKAVREAEGRYFAAVPDAPSLYPGPSNRPAAVSSGGAGLWLTSLKYDAASLILVIVLLAGSFTATGAAFSGDFSSAGVVLCLLGGLALAGAALFPLILVRKARRRWLSTTALYEGYAYFKAYARDRASTAGEAVDIARGDGIFNNLFRQAADRSLITPAVVFYRQLQEKRKTGEITEEQYRDAVDELLEREVAWRRRGGKA